MGSQLAHLKIFWNMRRSSCTEVVMYICTKNKLSFKENKIKFMQKIKVRTNSTVTPQAVSKSLKGIDKNNAE